MIHKVEHVQTMFHTPAMGERNIKIGVPAGTFLVTPIARTDSPDRNDQDVTVVRDKRYK